MRQWHGVAELGRATLAGWRIAAAARRRTGPPQPSQALNQERRAAAAAAPKGNLACYGATGRYGLQPIVRMRRAASPSGAFSFTGRSNALRLARQSGSHLPFAGLSCKPPARLLAEAARFQRDRKILKFGRTGGYFRRTVRRLALQTRPTGLCGHAAIQLCQTVLQRTFFAGDLFHSMLPTSR